MQEIKRAENCLYIGESLEKALAKLTWTGEAKTKVIDHVYVSEELRGQGIASKLVGKAVEMAREEGLSLRATCPFAKAVLDKNEDFHDVYQKN